MFIAAHLFMLCVRVFTCLLVRSLAYSFATVTLFTFFSVAFSSHIFSFFHVPSLSLFARARQELSQYHNRFVFCALSFDKHIYICVTIFSLYYTCLVFVFGVCVLLRSYQSRFCFSFSNQNESRSAQSTERLHQISSHITYRVR